MQLEFDHGRGGGGVPVHRPVTLRACDHRTDHTNGHQERVRAGNALLDVAKGQRAASQVPGARPGGAPG